MKIKRLSNQKIQIECPIDIISNNLVIDSIKLNFIFKSELTGGKFFDPRSRKGFLQRISGDYKIKMKNLVIHQISLVENFEDRDIYINGVVNKVEIYDITWYRNYIINNILEN